MKDLLKKLFTWDRIKSILYTLGGILVAVGLAEDEEIVKEAIGGLLAFVAFILEFFGVDVDAPKEPEGN
jgi:4-hydroxybenzoate polyprenyltransferase